ncbi:hypothetical protein QCA50_007624 [Cerrena zonata]|uniref:F-box domain-containing protein n=1 Tax=Cerrena zonata TaxID=2478898 RepID=A0AAW0G6H5_9APHY
MFTPSTSLEGIRILSPISIKHIQEFMALLPKLQCLRLMGLTLSPHPSFCDTRTAIHLTTLQSKLLDLKRVAISEAEQYPIPILNLLSLFSQIERLRIIGSISGLRSYELPVELFQKLLEYAIQLNTATSFASSVADAQCIDDILESFNNLDKENLSRIELIFPSFKSRNLNSVAPVRSRTELKMFRVLQELQLRLDYTIMTLHPEDQWSCMNNFLEKIPVANIFKILILVYTKVEVSPPMPHHKFARKKKNVPPKVVHKWTTSLDWDRLRSSLRSMPVLQRINVRVVQIIISNNIRQASERVTKRYYEDIRGAFQKELSEFKGRRMLYISQKLAIDPRIL